ncbi:NADP-dependent oxidoreductase [Cumulibacter soli]|uniref:NADP-dependent oxidoreductase n=1 Tax=Cumulibacter soli TaxID=2546344 RepID=UPI001ABB642E|nr:NADP-dependent oxidoreductase [Cumulibacter soli]
MQNRQIRYVKRPTGALGVDTFELGEAPMPQPAAGEVLCRNLLVSIDPANRAWMQGATYRSQLNEGDVMAGYGLAEVIEGADGIAAGSIVGGDFGWQEYAVLPAGQVEPLAVEGELSHYMSILGITGLTAYFGLLSVGRPAAGETVLVSGAAGATGNVVGQLAKLHGCRVVGIVGNAEKAAFLTDELGFDAAVNYRSETYYQDLKAACPDRVDVYFDNVGGQTLEYALRLLNQHGRIVCCGSVSAYDGEAPEAGPRGVPGLITTKRIRMEGLLVFDFQDEFDQARAQLRSWVEDGKVKVVQDVLEGIEQLPQALVGLLAGENVGKRMVRVAEQS